MASATIEEVKKQLAILLSQEPETDIVDYILGIQNEDDFEEFMQNIVNTNNKSHISAQNNIRNFLFRSKNNKSSNNGLKNSTSNIPAKANSGVIEKPKYTGKNKGKGKKKYQNIDSHSEQKKIAQGRTECGCQGQTHEFMNNCLSCGRIHCVEEGPGPCFFCGVAINATGPSATFSENDTFTPKANTIYDDDNDYFKIKQDDDGKNKRSMVIALDFATRRVIESTEEDEKIKKKILEGCKKHLKNVDKLYKNLQRSSEFQPVTNIYDEMVDLLVKMRHVKPSGEEILGEEDGLMPKIEYKSKIISDGFDLGLCLSMHQPYASLLMAGVKKHEGRNWPTNHVGTLWIAAAAHKPDPDEISMLEEFYSCYYDEPKLKFPSSYPTSCLLGCVEVEDCMSQENYRKQFPVGESESPFVMICSKPIILPIFYPIIGKHKIYPLEKDLHKCAKMCLRYAKLIE